MSTIGERLKAERLRLRLSQAELAGRTGIHRRTQVNYESDKRVPPANYLDAAAKLGMDTDFVTTGVKAVESGALLRVQNALLFSLLSALGYGNGEPQIDEALEIWTAPSEAQAASGGIDGFAGRLVGMSSTVAQIRDDARQIDTDLLISAIEAVETPAKAARFSIPADKRAIIISALYRTALTTGRIDQRDISGMLALLS